MVFPRSRDYCDRCAVRLRTGVSLCSICETGVWPGWDMRGERDDKGNYYVTFWEWVMGDEQVVRKVLGSWCFTETVYYKRTFRIIVNMVTYKKKD